MITTSLAISFYFLPPEEHAEKRTGTRDELMNPCSPSYIERWKMNDHLELFHSILSINWQFIKVRYMPEETSQTQEKQLHKEHDELRRARSEEVRMRGLRGGKISR